MTAKPDQPEQRNRALARMLAEALNPAASAQATSHSACPDAELLATYADQGLDSSERDRLDSHFAACGRCQKILTVLAVTGDEPLTEQEVRRFGERVAAASAPAIPVPAKPQARSSPPPQRWFWWMAPAFGAAAAVMLWMVLRPISPGGTASVQTAADYAQPAQQEIDSLSARSNAPSPPSEAVAPQAKAANGPGLEAEKLRAEAGNEQSSRGAQRLGGATVAGARDESAQPAAPGRAVGATAAMGALATATPAATPAPPISEQESAVASRGDANRTPQLQARALAMEPTQSAQFSSPDGSRRWRLGAGGRIEHSTDGGRTWQVQPSGVTTDLLAGAAPSAQVAWVVGRAGIILRLTDDPAFPQWQRIPPPSGATVDWVGLEARDALRATVIAADGRRFSTETGGRTWTPQ